MEKLIKFKVRVITHSLIAMFIGIFIFALIDFGGPLLLGWVYGAILAILIFLLLSRTMEKAVTFEPQKARVYTIFNYFMRYIVLLAALYVAIQRPDMSIITVVLGLIIPKLVILYYDVGIYSLRRNKSHPHKEQKE